MLRIPCYLLKFIQIIIIIFPHCLIAQEKINISIKEDAFQYSGEYADHESHLQYLLARYYQPAIPRFINRDSDDLFNRYDYSDGNPINNEDPSGHFSVGPSDAATLGVGGITGAMALGGYGIASGEFAFLGNAAVAAGQLATGHSGAALVDALGGLASYTGLPSTNPETFRFTKQWINMETYNASVGDGYGYLNATDFERDRNQLMAKWSKIATGISGVQLGINTEMDSNGQISWSSKTALYAGAGLVGGIFGGWAYGNVGAALSSQLRNRVSGEEGSILNDTYTGRALFGLGAAGVGFMRSAFKEFSRSLVTNGIIAAYNGDTGQGEDRGELVNTVIADTITGGAFGILSGVTSEYNRVGLYSNRFTFATFMLYRSVRDVLIGRVQNNLHSDIQVTDY